MLVRIFRAVFLAIMLLGVSQIASSQTIRVSVGVNDSGVESYIEAYEYNCCTEKPCFPGGYGKFIEFVNANRQYPREAYQKGIRGTVTCQFIVHPDGTVSNVTLVRKANQLLNEEALRVFNLMPRWIPGRVDGIPVPVRVTESIKFRR